MKKNFRVEGLDCGNCAAKIERAVKALDGVTSASVNFMLGKMTVEAAEDRMPQVMAQVEKIVRKIEPDAVLKAL